MKQPPGSARRTRSRFRTDPLERIVVVGAGLAGLRAAEALRREGFAGQLILLGDEAHLPYDRPPLSKQYLAGTWDMDHVWLGVDDELDLDVRLGASAVALDVSSSTLKLNDGDALSFDGLVIATGATPRVLPGFDGAYVLRTLDDARALQAALQPGVKVAVIGAGFIGSEVAATARALGCEVTILESAPAPLARVFPTAIGESIADLHRDHGVTLRCGEKIAGRAEIDADVVVVGIGVVPNTGWLEGSGLTIDNGVVCDATCAAVGGEGRVVAAGDVARWPNQLFGGQLMRVEHWTHAAEQANAAACTLLGARQPFSPAPYFWSDQYDVKIQFAGTCSATDEFVVLEGSFEDRKFLAGFGRDGQLVGALAFSMPRQLMQCRTLIADGAPFPGR